jgi:shikimate kinase
MGSGKSSVGRFLAERLDLNFVDLDERIEAREQATISVLFRERGESGFRLAERYALDEVLAEGPCVLACGGGTPCQPGAMDRLKFWGNTVFLDVPWVALSKRDLQGRPLWDASAEDLLAQRRPVYEQAHICLDAAQPIPRVVDAALACLGLIP